MRTYYITFCWNREFLYDGYIIKKDDDRMMGFTDDAILAGDENKILEVRRNAMIEYEIIGDYFYNFPNGFEFNNVLETGDKIHSTVQATYMPVEKIQKIIQGKLAFYPESIRESFRENYLDEG